MSSTHSMNARKCVHAQKSNPSQAFAHESSKVGGRGKREEERQERQRPGGWWKERQPNKTKTHRRNENKSYLGTVKVNNVNAPKYFFICINSFTVRKNGIRIYVYGEIYRDMLYIFIKYVTNYWIKSSL